MKCPICNQELPVHSRGIYYHAKSHSLTVEELWLKVNNLSSSPTCACSKECNKLVRFYNWKKGYLKYVAGHSNKETKSKNTKEQLKKHHWARGKTKDTYESIKKASVKTSESLKVGFSNGQIKHWSKDNNIRDEVIKKIVAKRKGKESKRSEHWKWSNSNDLFERILISTKNRFVVTTNLGQDLTISFLDERINNKEKCLEAVCKRCDQKRTVSVYDLVRTEKLNCRNCDKQFVSKFEQEVFDFVQTITPCTKKYGPWGELDIFVKEKSFGIECNGLYWHSEAIQSNNMYHENKRVLCEKHGIKLMHLFEDEWREKKRIVQSMIMHKLGKSKTIGARTLRLKIVSRQDRKIFFKQNHIDGDVASSEAIALINSRDEIIACASFRKQYLGTKKKNQVELARFACILNTVVPGALTRLIKAYKQRHPNDLIISYQDLRFGGTGKHYEACGFVKVKETPPRFWWTDTTNRFGRLTVKADSDCGLSEKDVSAKKRRLKIWGTKNILWSL